MRAHWQTTHACGVRGVPMQPITSGAYLRSNDDDFIDYTAAPT
jgi:hypothetical protein